MNLHELLSELESRAIRLSVEGQQLRINAPKGALTPQLRERLEHMRTEVMGFVSAGTPGSENIRVVPLRRSARDWCCPRVKPGCGS